LKKHPEKALTAVKIRNAKPGRHADGNGLYLVVDDSGAKRWILRTVIKGRRTDLGLGGLSIVSLNEAREEARRLRRIARKGGDPLAERRQERRVVPTFEKAARTYHDSIAASFKNPKHRMQWINTLENYAFPTFGARSVDSIESADILAALSPIWTKKPETARRIKQRMRAVFDWAKASGYRPGDNPVDGISKVLPKHNLNNVEHHAALHYAQVPDFIGALRNAQAAEVVRLGLEFLILTASRTSEVLYAKWSEVDTENKKWTVPAERMKGKVEHQVPLTGRCLEILQAAKEINKGSEYIFPGRSLQKPLSTMAFEMALRRMGRDEITVHGFRSSFRDWAAERTNTEHDVVEAALAHKVESKVEAAYRRSTLFDKRRDLMNRWTAFATAKPSTKVVQIREA
jgi:integrase